MIDAAWVFGDGAVYGDSGSSDYISVAWGTGAGKGATITPTKGDTAKTMFVPNSGRRDATTIEDHGVAIYVWAATQQATEISQAYCLHFDNDAKFGYFGWGSKLRAFSLRCVRS